MRSLRSCFYRACARIGVVNLDLALEDAAAKGDAGSVRAFLEAGADVHARHEQALSNAAATGTSEVVRILLDAGAVVYEGEGHALWYARAYHRTEIVDIMRDWMRRHSQQNALQPFVQPE